MTLPPGPFITALAAVLAVFHILLVVTGLWPDAAVMGGFIPARFGAGMVEGGPLVPAILTPFTAFFIHYDIVALAFNALILLFIGRQLEQPLGKAALSVLLVAGAFGGALMLWIAQPRLGIPLLGANASVAALLAVFALVFNRTDMRPVGPISGPWVRVLWLGAAWIGLQLLIGVAAGGFELPTIWASIGGFLTGLALARPVLRWRFRGR